MEWKALRSRGDLVFVFKVGRVSEWLKIEGMSRKGKKREGLANKGIGVLD